MKAWELILNMIKAQGVEYTFGIGDTDLQLYADKVEGLSAINLRYEGSAPFMAMAYSRLTGKPGVCSGSSGPGVANLVPGVLEAYSGCVPLVILAPAVDLRTEGMGEFQECDQRRMMEPITKWSARIPYVERIPWYINRAFSIAINGQPGPVFLEMPINVGGKITSGIEIEVGPMPEYNPSQKIRMSGDPELIKNASKLLLTAERPILIAGNGVILSGATDEFKEFIELQSLPFLTTPAGRGIVSENHPLAMGVSGLYRTKVAKEYYNDADLVISLGSRNESFQTHGWADFPKGARFIQVDISPFEIGRNWRPDVAVIGDVKLVLRQLNSVIKKQLQEKENYLEKPRVKALIQAKEEFEREVDKECMVEDTPIPAKRIVHEVSRVFGKNTILANENGSQDTWSYCYPYYKVQEGSACIPVAEQTCMGMGVVGAIAAKLTNPEKKVVCIVGDGAFQMYMKEIPTAVQYKVGCTWVVLNNSAFGWVKYNQKKYAGRDSSTFKVQPDFVKWAEACNCYGRKIEKSSDIQPALEEVLKLNKKGIPVVLDFITGLDLSHFDRSK
jgi:acetolactate synthase-1/2/3 large subunit